MSIFSTIGDILKAASSVVPVPGLSEIGDALSKTQTTPEQEAQLQTIMTKHEEVMKGLQIDEMKTFISESFAEINSSDKYTSRARPTGVYAATLITFILACGMLWGVKLDTGAIATLLVPLWGSAVYYTYNRTQEKLNELSNHS